MEPSRLNVARENGLEAALSRGRSCLQAAKRLIVAMISLPTELLENIIDNLDDQPTLLSCALVAKAWVSVSQRSIFHTLVLEAPISDLDLIAAYLAAKERLLSIFDENPRIPTYIRSFELHQFDGFGDKLPQFREEIHDSTARVIHRLSNVENLLFLSINWGQFSTALKTAVVDLFSAPSITRITLEMFMIPKFAEFVSLLGCIRNLKVLNILHLNCTADWDVPIPEEESPKEDNALTMMRNPAPPRSIHLNEVLHLDMVRICPFAAWLQQDSCPIEVQNLHSLHIHHSIALNDYRETASILELVGGNLRELELQVPEWIHPNVVHLGYTPNLRNLWLNVHQTDTYTPVPWIQSFFEPLLHLNRTSCPLQCLTIQLYAKHSDSSSTHQWQEWSKIDALLTTPEFSLLETVKIELSLRAKRKWTEQFSRLDRLGKLNVRMS